jgi:hypothetical protein
MKLNTHTHTSQIEIMNERAIFWENWVKKDLCGVGSGWTEFLVLLTRESSCF